LGAPTVLCRSGKLTLALAITLGVPVALAAPPAPKSMGCLIEPDQVAELGSQVVGVVERIDVERGTVVRAGQSLLRLRADVERANAGAAETRARIDADVLAATANLELAEQKQRRAESLVAQGFVSDQAAELARGEAEVARQKLRQVRGQQRISQEEQRVAQAQLALRTVHSPFAGVVVERYVNVGERVEEKPLLRVAVVNPLRVELMVPTAQYGTLSAGDRVSIRPELPGAGAVTAVVRQVDQVLDAASNSFRVRLTLANPGNRLPAGLRCKADLPATVAGSMPPPLKVAPVVDRSPPTGVRSPSL
jgi:RND family efflux transporter MFP subunit